MNDSTSPYKIWQQAVAATEAMLKQRGYTAQKAHKCALDRNAKLHPTAQKALKTHMANAAIRNARHAALDGATWAQLNGVQS